MLMHQFLDLSVPLLLDSISFKLVYMEPFLVLVSKSDLLHKHVKQNS